MDYHDFLHSWASVVKINLVIIPKLINLRMFDFRNTFDIHKFHYLIFYVGYKSYCFTLLITFSNLQQLFYGERKKQSFTNTIWFIVLILWLKLGSAFVVRNVFVEVFVVVTHLMIESHILGRQAWSIYKYQPQKHSTNTSKKSCSIYFYLWTFVIRSADQTLD